MKTTTLSVNHKRYFHRFVKREQTLEIDLLSWLSSQNLSPKAYWKSRNEEKEIALIGSILTLHEVPVFNSGNESPAKFWGGQTFFPKSSSKDESWHTFPKVAFFLPKYEVIKKGETLEVITHSINAPITEELQILPTPVSPPITACQKGAHFPSKENWETLIENSLEKIEKGAFQKVIMARRSTHEADSSVDPFALLCSGKAQGATCFAFQFDEKQTFIGATPERLYKREGSSLSTEAVAGTRQRGDTPEKDRLLEKELLESDKDKREFGFVKTSLQTALEPLCEILNFGADKILKTPTVQHLSAKVQGQLKSGVNDGKLLDALHPSAALGGHPKEEALSHLKQSEPFERGWYGAPIGYISEKEAQFVVGIRSALVEEKQLHLFAGAGIVIGSDPKVEWEELGHKVKQWEKVIL